MYLYGFHEFAIYQNLVNPFYRIKNCKFQQIVLCCSLNRARQNLAALVVLGNWADMDLKRNG